MLSLGPCPHCGKATFLSLMSDRIYCVAPPAVCGYWEAAPLELVSAL